MAEGRPTATKAKLTATADVRTLERCTLQVQGGNAWLVAFRSDASFVQQFFVAPFQAATRRQFAEMSSQLAAYAQADKRRKADGGLSGGQQRGAPKAKKVKDNGKGGKGGKGKGGNHPKVCFSRLYISSECGYPGSCKFSHACQSCGASHSAAECDQLGTWTGSRADRE
jgi:hypothetical protein